MASSSSLVIPVLGMTCNACANRVQRAMVAVPGIDSAEVSFAARTAKVTLQDAARDLPRALEAILGAGYEPAANAEQILARRGRDELAKAELAKTRRDTQQSLLALAIAGLQMLFGMPMMAQGSAMRPAMAGPATHPAQRWVFLVLTLIVIVIARSFFVKAWSALRAKTADMNTLVALGAGTAFLYSSAATAWPGMFATDGQLPDVHFEAASFILAFVMLGRTLEAIARARTTSAQGSLLALVPVFAKVARDGKEERIAVSELRVGDVFVMRPGDRAPADGVITEGSSQIDEALLTGESERIRKGEGDAIHAGTIVVDGRLRARAVRTGEDTRVARIVALVEDAQATRAPVQRLADRIAARFAPGIVVVATLAALTWWVFGPEPKLVHAITTFVTVVVVSCPCALGLATPTAIATAIGRAAQLGILVRSGDALERAANIDTMALDKTGTLTAGEPEVLSFESVAGDAIDADAVLRFAASVERGSEHAVGRAILKEAAARELAVPEPSGFVATAGGGARANVEGHDVRVGAIVWLEREGIPMPESGAPDAAFGVSIDGVLRGHGIVADRLHDDARAAIAGLRRLKIDVLVLTGDRQDVAEAAGAALGVTDVRAELDPEHKLAVLDELARAGHQVGMCGDGVNDAPALARAHVGIALGTGTDAAIEASDVSLLDGGIARLPVAVELARRTLSIVRQNLAWAFAYNLALVPIAAGALVPWLGYRLPPAAASAAMALSSIRRRAELASSSSLPADALIYTAVDMLSVVQAVTTHRVCPCDCFANLALEDRVAGIRAVYKLDDALRGWGFTPMYDVHGDKLWREAQQKNDSTYRMVAVRFGECIYRRLLGSLIHECIHAFCGDVTKANYGVLFGLPYAVPSSVPEKEEEAFLDTFNFGEARAWVGVWLVGQRMFGLDWDLRTARDVGTYCFVGGNALVPAIAGYRPVAHIDRQHHPERYYAKGRKIEERARTWFNGDGHLDEVIAKINEAAAIGEKKRPLKYPDAKTIASTPPKKIGRNEPCVCGSAQKFKDCCATRESLSHFLPSISR